MFEWIHCGMHVKVLRVITTFAIKPNCISGNTRFDLTTANQLVLDGRDQHYRVRVLCAFVRHECGICVDVSN